MSPDDQTIADTTKVSTTDWLARAEDLAPTIAAAGDQIESERRIPEDLLAQIHDAQLFRLCLPHSLGGGEESPTTIFRISEIIGAADASTAWCLGQAWGCSLAAAYLAPKAAATVFADRDAVLAWGPPNSVATVTEVDGGYRITGHWTYGSGIRNATWVGAHCRVTTSGDGLKYQSDGSSPNRSFLFPVAEVETTDVWDVIGLRGTGSFEYAVEDLFVPTQHTFVQNSPTDRRETGPLYQIPVFTFYGIPFSGVAMGVARAALDDFKRLAQGKVAYRTTAPVRESSVVQAEVARCEAKLASSRAFLLEAFDETWNLAKQANGFPLESRARLRLAVTHAMNLSREVVEYAYRAGGGTAIFEGQPFARRFRDMHAISQQAQANERNYEAVGQAMLGLEPEGGRV